MGRPAASHPRRGAGALPWAPVLHMMAGGKGAGAPLCSTRMKQSHLIAVNTGIIWGTTVLQMIPPLIMVPFLIKTIGESGYGQYVLIWSLFMAIEQLEISLQSGVIKYGAAFMAEDRTGEVNKVLSSTSAFSLALGALFGLAVAGGAFLHIQHSPEMTASLIMVALVMVFLVPTTPFLGIIRAKQRHYYLALAAIAAQFGGLGLAVLWFKLVRPSVEALIAILAGAMLLSRLVQLPLAYRLVPGLQNRRRHFDRGIFRLVISFGAMTVLSSLCMAANSAGMRWLSGLLVSTKFVAHLAIFLMPSVILAQVVQAMTITVLPAASAYHATENYEMLKELLLRATRYIVLLVWAGLLAAVILVKGVLHVWLGPQYEFLSIYVLISLGGASVLVSASGAHHMLKGFARLDKILRAYVIGLVVIPVAVFLGIYLVWKAPYAAIVAGLFLGNVTAGILQLRDCAKAARIKGLELAGHSFLQPSLAGAASLLAALAVLALTGTRAFGVQIAIAAVAILIHFGAFYFFIATPRERSELRGLVLMIRDKIAGLFWRRSTSLGGGAGV